MAIPTGAERFPGAELFVYEEGMDEYARRVYWRAQADLMYLGLRGRMGRMEAAQAVCGQFGHEPRGTRCARCGGLV